MRAASITAGLAVGCADAARRDLLIRVCSLADQPALAIAAGVLSARIESTGRAARDALLGACRSRPVARF